MGVKLDNELNHQYVKGYEPGIYEIQAKDSKVKVLVATTNEELSIARETKALV
jgi:acetate kinase